MKKQTKIFGITLVILLHFLTGSFATAQRSAIDKDAEKILNAYVSAVGGEKELAKIENVVIKSDILIVEPGVTINREVVQDKTNKLHIKAYSSQTGEIFMGFDGSNYWEKNQSSVSEIDEERILSYLNEFAFMRFSEWKKNLLDANYLGLDSIDGEEFHCIAVKTIYGIKERWYFDTTDFLLSYMKEQLEMTSGTITVITKFDDYREVDGIKHPFTQYINMGQRNRKITHNSISHNQVIDPNLFTLPMAD
jgi:zinc protease